MIKEFTGLSEIEVQLMYDAVPLVTVLIAGADGNIDDDEKEWAKKLTKIRSYSYHESLKEYYKNIGENYQIKVDSMISHFSDEVNARNEAISAELAKLNDILSKLDPEFAQRFHKSLTTFALHVAKASGGFFRIGSISNEEKALIDLPMINPIVL